MTRPTILLDPHPRLAADILDAPTRAALDGLGEVVEHAAGPMPDALVDATLPRAALVLGQTRLDRARLDRAPALRGVINVETNFLPNIDYDECFRRGIHVLTPGSAFAPAVAEMALGMAIDLGRGVTAADRAFRAGTERWGLAGNAGCFTLAGAPVGLVGFGDLARAFLRLLAPFRCHVRAHDPWLPPLLLEREGVEPATLPDLLARSRFVLVFAGATSENAGFIGREQFALMRPGTAFLLLSRACVVDFPAMLAEAHSGRLRVATDVFPTEPVPAGDPVRAADNLLLSAHRAGALPDALLDIGRQAVGDAAMILRGLPPALCRRAAPETVARARSRPIERT